MGSLLTYRSYYLAASALILVAGGATYWFYDRENSTTAMSFELTKTFLSIERSIGYDGFIHHFKNHVLRPGDTSYGELARLSYEEATREIASLQSIIGRADINVDLSELQSTLNRYSNAINQVSEAHSRSIPIGNIDQLVRVPDRAASSILADLQRQIEDQLTQRQRSAETWGWLSLLLFLSILVSLAVSVINMWRSQQQKRENQRQEEELEKNRQHADQMDKLVDKLKLSNSELQNFAYAASHDMKTPLRGIASLASILREDEGDSLSDAALVYLDKLDTRVHRAESLLDGMLTYSRAGQHPESIEEVDSAQVVSSSIELISPPEGMSFVVADNLPTLQTIVQPLQQVFLNLIGNAVKYHDKASGVIEVRAEEDGEFVRFTVSDDGPGIDPIYHERIFEMFQRLQSKDEEEGNGLGLALVRKVIRQFGGNICVESKLGEGASFHFSWPRNLNR